MVVGHVRHPGGTSVRSRDSEHELAEYERRPPAEHGRSIEPPVSAHERDRRGDACGCRAGTASISGCILMNDVIAATVSVLVVERSSRHDFLDHPHAMAVSHRLRVRHQRWTRDQTRSARTCTTVPHFPMWPSAFRARHSRFGCRRRPSSAPCPFLPALGTAEDQLVVRPRRRRRRAPIDLRRRRCTRHVWTEVLGMPAGPRHVGRIRS